MKKIIILNICIILAFAAKAQDFKKSVSTAKTSYASGKLEDAHFALQQMLSELDIIIGKEVLKLLPAKMDSLKSNASDDNVTGNISFVGATIHRTYGMGTKKAELDIVNNSPLLGTLNALISTPLMGMFNDGKTKILKVQGYKARLTKEEDSDAGKPTYRLEMPFSNALITLKVNNSSEAEVTSMINTLPLDQIAKLIQ
jgi:hypothetical protein